MSYIPLPRELLESITDHLQNDIHALQASSLISRAFRSPSQRHLFSSIEIAVSDKPYNRRFYDILSIHPEIALHVKKLKLLLIDNYKIGTPDDILVVEEDALIAMLQMLSCLQTLDFGSYWFGTAQWESYSVDLRSSILGLLRLPNLQHVVASQIADFPCASAFEGCNLKTLKTSYLNTSMDLDLTLLNFDRVQGEGKRTKPWNVETLIMDSIPNMVPSVLGSLVPLSRLSGVIFLTTLEIGQVGTDDGIDLCQRVLECSSTLEHLTLRIVEPCMSIQSTLNLLYINRNRILDLRPWPKPIRLESLPSLRVLNLHVARNPRQALTWIYEALSSIPPSNGLETMKLFLGDIIAPTTLEETQWRMVDSMIQNWDDPQLNLVHLSVYASGLEPDFSRFLLTKIPNLFLRHMVSITNNGIHIYPHKRSGFHDTSSIP